MKDGSLAGTSGKLKNRLRCVAPVLSKGLRHENCGFLPSKFTVNGMTDVTRRFSANEYESRRKADFSTGITMPLSITVLLENHKNNKSLIAKPGLSLLLQDEYSTVLFDTGPDGSFLHNAQKMGVTLSDLTAVVLSHGHYDHCGGVPWLMKETRIICHPAVNKKRYAAVNVMGHKIKMKQLSADVDFTNHNMEYTRQPVTISKNFLWSGEVFTREPKAYGLLEGDSCRQDFIDDEGVLIYHSPLGLVIVTGCGHKGLINIVCHCQKITGDNRVYAIIGGFHLRCASLHNLLEVRCFIQELKPRWVMGCHCTGWWGRLWLPDPTELITGSRIVLP